MAEHLKIIFLRKSSAFPNLSLNTLFPLVVRRISGIDYRFHLILTLRPSHSINYPSTKSFFKSDGFTENFSSFMFFSQRPVNEIYAQYGTYLRILTAEFGSASFILPALSVSFMIRDTIALFASLMPKRSLKTVFDTSMLFTWQ